MPCHAMLYHASPHSMEGDPQHVIDCSILLDYLAAIPPDALPRLETLSLSDLTSCWLPLELPGSCLTRLRSLTIGVEHCVYGLHMLSDCPQLSVLHILNANNDRYPDMDCNDLAGAIPSLTNLTSLHIYASIFSAGLLTTLSNLTKLESLHLGFCDSCDEAATGALAGALCHTRALTNLRFGPLGPDPDAVITRPPLPPTELSGLVKPLRTALPTLAKLCLHHVPVPAAVLVSIGSIRLQELELNDTELDADAQSALVALLRGPLGTSGSLRRLALGQLPPQLTAEMGTMLGAACGGVSSLRELVLWTQPGEAAPTSPAVHAALLPGLTSAPLTQLLLGSSEMGVQGIVALSQAMQQAQCGWCRTLRVLYVDEAVGPEGPVMEFYVSLAGLLAVFTSCAESQLQQLDIGGNTLSLVGLVTVAPELARLPTLTHLGCACNDLGVLGGNVLEVLLLRCLPKLHTLLVGGNGGWLPPASALTGLSALQRLDCEPFPELAGELQHLRTVLPAVVITTDQVTNLDVLQHG